MKINCRSILFKLGLSLIAVSLLASTIRYYAIETFREGSSRSLLAPAGQMLEPEKANSLSPPSATPEPATLR